MTVPAHEPAAPAGIGPAAAARSGAPTPRGPRWQPWAALALFAFLLNFVWEVLQAPFYRGMADSAHWTAVRTCTLATVGDVVIMLVAYALVAAPARDRWWLAVPTPARVGGFLTAGVAATIALKALNVYGLGRWAYGRLMPVVFGIGLAPVLQWLVLPPATLWLARRHLAGAPVRRTPANSPPTGPHP